MAKFTAKYVRENLGEILEVQALEDIIKKGQDEKNILAVLSQAVCVCTAIGVANIFEQKFPQGIDELVAENKEEFIAFIKEVIKDETLVKALQVPVITDYLLPLIGLDDIEIPKVAGSYEAMDLEELKALAKERGIKVTKKDDEESLIEKLEEYDAENVEEDDEEEEDEIEDEEEADEDDEADDEEDELEDDEDEESSDVEDALGSLELADLKKVAKALKIKVAKKDDEDVIIEKLQEADADELENVLIELGYMEADEEDEIEDEEEEELEDDEEELEDEEDEESDESPLANLELADLKKVAKALKVKVAKKDDEATIIEKLEEVDAEELQATLVELGFAESDEEAEDENEEDGDDESLDEELEELDEILDEEFEEEVVKEETKGKKGKGGKGKNK